MFLLFLDCTTARRAPKSTSWHPQNDKASSLGQTLTPRLRRFPPPSPEDAEDLMVPTTFSCNPSMNLPTPEHASRDKDVRTGIYPNIASALPCSEEILK